MKILVTGAGGFVGRALARRLVTGPMDFERLTLLDTAVPDAPTDPRVRVVVGSVADRALRQRALEGGADIVFHLAGVLSAASEGDYAVSRRINLDATLNLFEDAVRAGRRPRVVFTSSIAVFGALMPPHVDDDTGPAPTLTYGGHKQMCEIALADFSRRGAFDGISVRLPGIVARPFGGISTKSAFLSDIFHAFARGEKFTSPVSAEATFWLMSVARCVDNLVHASQAPLGALPATRAVTLPALRLTVPLLVDALMHATRRNAALVTYEPDPAIEAVFGRYPPLLTPLADLMGFRHDGDAAMLAETVLRDLDRS